MTKETVSETKPIIQQATKGQRTKLAEIWALHSSGSSIKALAIAQAKLEQIPPHQPDSEYAKELVIMIVVLAMSCAKQVDLNVSKDESNKKSPAEGIQYFLQIAAQTALDNFPLGDSVADETMLAEQGRTWETVYGTENAVAEILRHLGKLYELLALVAGEPELANLSQACFRVLLNLSRTSRAALLYLVERGSGKEALRALIQYLKTYAKVQPQEAIVVALKLMARIVPVFSQPAQAREFIEEKWREIFKDSQLDGKLTELVANLRQISQVANEDGKIYQLNSG